MLARIARALRHMHCNDREAKTSGVVSSVFGGAHSLEKSMSVPLSTTPAPPPLDVSARARTPHRRPQRRSGPARGDCVTWGAGKAALPERVVHRSMIAPRKHWRRARALFRCCGVYATPCEFGGFPVTGDADDKSRQRRQSTGCTTARTSLLFNDGRPDKQHAGSDARSVSLATSATPQLEPARAQAHWRDRRRANCAHNSAGRVNTTLALSCH